MSGCHHRLDSILTTCGPTALHLQKIGDQRYPTSLCPPHTYSTHLHSSPCPLSPRPQLPPCPIVLSCSEPPYPPPPCQPHLRYPLYPCLYLPACHCLPRDLPSVYISVILNLVFDTICESTQCCLFFLWKKILPKVVEKGGREYWYLYPSS